MHRPIRPSGFAVLVFVFGCVQAAIAQACEHAPAPAVTGREIVSFRLFIPADSQTPFALVLDLHGSGGTAEAQARTSGLDYLAAREGFAVATLEADTGRRLRE